MPSRIERRRVAQLRQHEGNGEHRTGSEEPEHWGAGPTTLGCLDDADHEEQQCTCARDSTEQVKVREASQATDRGRNDSPADGDQQQRDRAGQQEHGSPAELGEHSPEHQAQREATRADDGVDAQRLVAGRAFGERRGDDGQAGRYRERRRHALDEPERNDRFGTAEGRAHDRREAEDRYGDQEDRTAPEQVSGTPTEQQQSPVSEDVAADDPLQGRCGHAEVSPDGRQRHAHHRDVETVEEQRAAQDDE